MGRIAKVCIRTGIVTGLLCLAACSSTTFVYNRLDSILPWYLDDYVELDDPQEEVLDRTLGPFLHWHRMQELPRYLELLDQFDTSLGEPLTPEVLTGLYAGLETAWLRLEKESLDWLLELGASLSEEQVQQFLAYLQERQQDYEKEYLTRSEKKYREESYDNFAENMQDYLGRLTPGQDEQLRAAIASLERSDSIWLQERAAWLQRLAVLLERQPGWQQQVRDAISRRDETVAPRYREVFEHNLEVIFTAVSGVLNSRTEKQDRHLRAELDNLREDLETLIAQGSAEQDRAA